METNVGLQPLVMTTITFALMAMYIAYKISLRRLALKHLATLIHQQRNFSKACLSDLERVSVLHSAEIQQYRSEYPVSHSLRREFIHIQRTMRSCELELMKIAIVNDHIYRVGSQLNQKEKIILAKSMVQWDVKMQQHYLNRLLAPIENSAGLEICIVPPANWAQRLSIRFSQAMIDLRGMPKLPFSSQKLPEGEHPALA
jgi:hypothetical protein